MSRPALFILASGSPRRRELLTQARWEFEIQVADVHEIEPSDAPELSPQDLVLHNARLKACAVADQVTLPVLAADTTVAVDQTILTKPADLTEARRMLGLLQGRGHDVHTASVLQKGAQTLQETVTTTKVTFHALDHEAIDAYIHAVHVLDKAGAYAAQERGSEIIASLDGSYTNVVGLPMETVTPWLEKLRHSN